MNHWAFVIAAYAFTLVATAVLLVQSFVSMRKAEGRADRLREQK
jgi:heme exporter protein D